MVVRSLNLGLRLARLRLASLAPGFVLILLHRNHKQTLLYHDKAGAFLATHQQKQAVA